VRRARAARASAAARKGVTRASLRQGHEAPSEGVGPPPWATLSPWIDRAFSALTSHPGCRDSIAGFGITKRQPLLFGVRVRLVVGGQVGGLAFFFFGATVLVVVVADSMAAVYEGR